MLLFFDVPAVFSYIPVALPVLLELVVAVCACVAVGLAASRTPRFLPWLLALAASRIIATLGGIMSVINFGRMMYGASTYREAGTQTILIAQQVLSGLCYLLMITSMALLLIQLSSERGAASPAPPDR